MNEIKISLNLASVLLIDLYQAAVKVLFILVDV